MNQANNPLHGLTLEAILTDLQRQLGWEGLYQKIRVNCFSDNPSIKSSLKFLRKTQWARDKLEILYLTTHQLELPAHLLAVHTQTAPQKSQHKTSPTSAAGINSHIWGKK
ncbi:VF530 family DNA-binding protein [Shewanella sp. NIFS-20-20]|uniref:VF530 family protein n=1 Tax=Shewanella sp. NIFS-20-20 TaxID=2853806 RepID=UPI001C485F59|nr:VF530 family protein [Shewanella sp. NIFS-20-20]MBV7315170.1 VF530 family protein [Shewanella sp. NIFS-20-20]